MKVDLLKMEKIRVVDSKGKWVCSIDQSEIESVRVDDDRIEGKVLVIKIHK